MTRVRLLGTVGVLGLCLLVPLVSADDRRDERKADKKPVGDARFVWEASGAGLAEVNFGMLAARLARDPAVRSFDERMVADHRKANAELVYMANQKKWELAPEMDREHKTEYDKLARMTGDKFDRTYMDGQLRDHEKAVSLFEDASKNAEDGQLKAWASRTLPTLRTHQKMVRDWVKEHGGSGHDRDKGGR
jgi:putative membrane protein